MILNRTRRAAVAALLATVAATPALADEGKWLPSQTPQIAAKMKAAGLKLDPAKLGDLNLAPLTAIASLGGCSASFVSSEGLLVTNHHCVYGSVQYNSKPGQDYLADGFLAPSFAEELPGAPGTRIFVIESLKDVTADVTRGLSDKMSGLLRAERIEASRKALISACEKQPSRRCDVRAYYGGATYFLQQQLEIKDVRLVYAPPSSVGNFGGEIDNWQWPRHTGDWGFYRAYVAKDGSSATYAKDNVPFHPKAHLTIATDPLKDGDFVMVAGFPGYTNRLATAAEAKFQYGTYYPAFQKFLSDYSDAIMAATAGNKATTIAYASIVRGADNYKKNALGQIAGAEAIGLNEKKAADEKAYRDWIAASPANAKYGYAAQALDRIVAEEEQRQIADMRRSALNRAQLLMAARTALRWAQERAKPDAERDIGFQDRDRQSIVERLTQIERRYDPKVDRILFEQAMREYAAIPADKQDPAFLAAVKAAGIDTLYSGTKLADTPTRIGWLDKPVAAFEGSDDPFIKLAVAMAPGDAKARAEGKDLEGRDQMARSVYLKGLIAFAASKGEAVAPDANSSLRFSYGNITGKSRDGMRWMPFTTVEGVVEKTTGREPFISPDKLVAAVKAKDYGRYADPILGTVPVDFLSTLDITGGNSGSATLNAKGELVGLAFDGTIEGVVSDWYYEPSINRSISVDQRYMRWVMEKVDGAGRLLAEMGVK
ncbi:S46 family peptidase [Sphingomonas naphthae]|uniref:Dipeptidyl-peptidase n=1 Tax=Sphingomonas naphthae TaxID=1813468 RepID=A0ABY7TPU5_9SPHN|nr:S46 family peptidase [Sphingomonas naphthae]WCT74380.1 S46 family peptidase [Sphingomonas naphthae]